MEHSNLPLSGLRVVDFSRVLAGPFCTALLGDLGAEVVKIEPPQGDDYRAIGPMVEGESALFTAMNRNKKSVVLDLKSENGLQLARALVEKADVVVENFRPGVAEKLGIGYRALSEFNPSLIYASISGFGQSGPESHRPAYDIVLQAMTGLMDATGFADGPPTMVGEAVSDVVSGLFGSWGILVALLARAKSGRGTHVDIAMFDATLSLAATLVSRYALTGIAPQRVGNRHPISAPFGAYRARDGFYVVAVLNDKLFAGFAAAIGRPDLAADPRFATDELRSLHETLLREAIEAWSQALSIEQVNQRLSAAAIPVAPIWNVSDALESAQSVARKLLTPLNDSPLPGVRLPSQPIKFSAFGDNRVTRAPQLGEHSVQIFQDWLGMDVS
ncbi:CoA transferase [Crenobacter sp. SG2305]|uniref:CaiB/BaiF CoA transferase family protein n=1 Tax=Crenobacter oryzisoli TaxID=3056844 RepID=UPI0025AA92F2|nr:CoA transferase [Crenobacter sp. SG2305]MDN0083757.1 CoA transferase [Crenobacter sp. SG2305]